MNPFIEAIRANPADDAPRLVYADYLDEQGECERAEFVRLQIRNGDRGRLRELFETNVCNWVRYDDVHSDKFAVRCDGVELEFVRGFVHHIDASAVWLLRYSRLLFNEPVCEVQTYSNLRFEPLFPRGIKWNLLLTL